MVLKRRILTNLLFTKNFTMANKIKIDNDYYEASSSEDDYTAEDKQLLQKVRKRYQREPESRHNILPLVQDETDESDDDEEDFNADSDIERADDNDDIPDARAWGKKRRDFYSTDFDEQTPGKYSARDEDLAEQEEAEARAIQQRLAKNLAEADFSLDTFVSSVATDKTKRNKKEKATEIILKKDLSELTERQKEQLFEQESPEFPNLVQDMTDRLIESSQLLEPALEFLESNLDGNQPLVEFVKLRNYINLNYATNVGFYLVLKSKRLPIKNHPVIKRLVQIRQLLLQLEDKFVKTVKPLLKNIVDSLKDGKEITIKAQSTPDEMVDAAQNKSLEKSRKKKLNLLKSVEAEMEMDEEDDNDGFGVSGEDAENTEDEKELEEEEGEIDEDDERRKITYQMAKNKGLTPYRKKELRNPRVKYRNRFQKALVRRKGAVRTVRKEIKRYDGEKFGIKTTVKKGIKIK